MDRIALRSRLGDVAGRIRRDLPMRRNRMHMLSWQRVNFKRKNIVQIRVQTVSSPSTILDASLSISSSPPVARRLPAAPLFHSSETFLGTHAHWYTRSELLARQGLLDRVSSRLAPAHYGN